jgi:hypothetical protein
VAELSLNEVVPPADGRFVAAVVQLASPREFFFCTVKLCGNNDDPGGTEFHANVTDFALAL